MKTITLKNPTDKDILSYPIEEAEYDTLGNVKYAPDGNYMKTDRTLEWTIKSGETVEFPDYVANYLKSIYDFLEVMEVEVETVPVELIEKSENTIEAKPATGNIVCKYCGANFKNEKAIALHLAHKHTKELLE